jgi:HAD superfamily hydrolase (TIGR01509 family)
MDGLLVDSEPLSTRAWRRLLADQGLVFDIETERAIIGIRASESTRYVCNKFNLEVSRDWLEDQRRKIILELVDQEIRPMPGMYDLFNALEGRDLPLGVATSSDSIIANAILESIKILDKLSTVVSGDMVEKGKPEPDIYLAAANALSVSPSKCLALEDSPKGVLAARNAGMHCIAVPNEMTAEMDLSNAKWVFPSLGDVAERLDYLLNGQ